jgi:hypothetical protein
MRIRSSKTSAYLWYFTQIYDAQIWEHKKKESKHDVSITVKDGQLTVETNLAKFPCFGKRHLDPDDNKLSAFSEDGKLKLIITKVTDSPSTFRIVQVRESDNDITLYRGRILEYLWEDPHALSPESYKRMKQVMEERTKSYEEYMSSRQPSSSDEE